MFRLLLKFIKEAGHNKNIHQSFSWICFSLCLSLSLSLSLSLRTRPFSGGTFTCNKSFSADWGMCFWEWQLPRHSKFSRIKIQIHHLWVFFKTQKVYSEALNFIESSVAIGSLIFKNLVKTVFENAKQNELFR